MRVIIDCIVHKKSKNKALLLHKYGDLFTLAGNLSPQCQFLIFTNEPMAHVENTNAVQVYSFREPVTLVNQLLLTNRIKQKIIPWQADVIIHSGNLPYLKHTQHVHFIKTESELTELSAKKIKRAGLFFAASVLIQQHLIHNHQIPSEKIIVTPFAITPYYKSIGPEQKENIKLKYSSGAEFLLYNHHPSSEPEFVQLLRAYSMFKKRLQTNMKLLIPRNFPVTNKKVAQLLETYKFKEDIVFTGTITVDQTAELTAAAYAVIQSAQKQSVSQIQDILQCGVPVIILQPDGWTKDQDCFEYANALSPEEIAGKMMQLYKDEAHRNKLISNSQQLLSQFSVEATAKTFHTALLRAAAE